MFYPVRVYDAGGNLKHVISSDELKERSEEEIISTYCAGKLAHEAEYGTCEYPECRVRFRKKRLNQSYCSRVHRELDARRIRRLKKLEK